MNCDYYLENCFKPMERLCEFLTSVEKYSRSTLFYTIFIEVTKQI